MEPLRVCLCLFFALAFAFGCDVNNNNNNFETKKFDEGVYISMTTNSYFRALYEFWKYSRTMNYQNISMKLGPSIVQVEKGCEKDGLEKSGKRIVFTRKLPDYLISNPPQPYSKYLKIDYQLGKSNDYYTKKIFGLFLTKSQITKFIKELKCNKMPIQDKWYQIIYSYKFPFGYNEILIPKSNAYSSMNKSRCPPDDSNIEKLCTGKSGYSCPDMSFEEIKGVSVRKVNMYIVTGEPSPGKNCSFNYVRYTQYLGNHYYFMGNNTQSKRMKRTIPVMTKAIRVSTHDEPCPKKYQMQFYVNTAHLDKTNLPCPTQPGVLLQKVENMEIYVKTFNGNPDTDMTQARDLFTKELDRRNLLYIKGRHYIAQYRGHGPKFGRTMEIWVEKTAPRYVTVCQGGNGKQQTTTPPLITSTTVAPSTTTTLTISYN